MAGNTIGNVFRLTTFGESHGSAIGGVVDGCPAGLTLDVDFIQQELNRRRPGYSEGSSPRKEEDIFQIVSGVYLGKSIGTPIAFIISNKDQQPSDYAHLEKTFRPSHADYTYTQKYGIRDPRGGGRSSARETAARVAGGAIAKLLLNSLNVRVQAYVSAIGPIMLAADYRTLTLEKAERSPVRCPDEETALNMISYLETLRSQGDSTGGVITGIISGVPPGWGEPVFDKLQADLAKAMLSINAVKGFEYGSGFAGASMIGSEHNDLFEPRQGNDNSQFIKTRTNYSGGIQGGISNGEDIYFRVAFKPVSTIMKDQISVDEQGHQVLLEGKGRHDICIAPRAVPIVEAMAAITLVDHYLRATFSKI
ncbi:MAG: chorismate synthase [Bacteroidales bacterium]|nr:chorismate synthase [Bacteroidales bacterium]MDZ4203238.1 chorismate synthase [Bacteroidales bacterium]